MYIFCLQKKTFHMSPRPFMRPPHPWNPAASFPMNLDYSCSILTSETFFPPVNHQFPCVFKEPCKISSPPLHPLWWGVSQDSASPISRISTGGAKQKRERCFIWDLTGCARESSSCLTSAPLCHILSSRSLPLSLGLIRTSLHSHQQLTWESSP